MTDKKETIFPAVSSEYTVLTEQEKEDYNAVANFFNDPDSTALIKNGADIVTDAMETVIKFFSDKANVTKLFVESAYKLIEGLNPDTIPADMLQDENIQLLADQLRAGDTKGVRKTISTKISIEQFFKLQESFSQADRAKNWQRSIEFYSMMNDKINHEFIISEPTIKEINGQVQHLWKVKKGNDERPAPVLACLTYRGSKNLKKTDKRITPFDEGVINAIGTIVHAQLIAGARFPIMFTVEDVWRTRNGITDTRRTPSKKQIKRYRDSIDKLRFVNLYLDRSEEIKQFNLRQADGTPIDTDKIDTSYILGSWETIGSRNGRQVEVFKLREMPQMFAYNLSLGHVVFVPFGLLSLSDQNITPYTEEIRDYLIKEIERLYNKSRNNSSFLFSTIYAAADWPTPAERIDRRKYKSEASYKSKIRTEEANDRKKIESILSELKDKKYIAGFKFNKKAGTYSVNVSLRSELYSDNRAGALLDPGMLNLAPKKIRTKTRCNPHKKPLQTAQKPVANRGAKNVKIAHK